MPVDWDRRSHKELPSASNLVSNDRTGIVGVLSYVRLRTGEIICLTGVQASQDRGLVCRSAHMSL